ncbi:MAG: hypothetical protein FWD49_04025 [Firmicutes bacterium]|nr:hypothetical protein [Bacillota bacterium]
MSNSIKKSELFSFIQRYLFSTANCDGKTVNYNRFSANESLGKIFDTLLNCFDYDCPDGYHYDEVIDTLTIFEHFEFDCSPNNKGGSMLRRNCSEVTKTINKELDNMGYGEFRSEKFVAQSEGVKDGNTVVYHMGADGDKFRDNYINNFKATFDNHAKKVNSYINNCKNALNKACSSVKICFIIEDITMGGTCYKNERGSRGNEVHLFFTKQFMDVFRDSPVDYVIFGMLQSPEMLTICDRTILADYDNVIDLKSMEFYVFPAMPQFTFAVKRPI